jgi:hypothetical protein
LKCIKTKSYFGEAQTGRWRVIFDAFITKSCEHTLICYSMSAHLSAYSNQ